MGYLTVPEYERLEVETLPVETQAGVVKHNESTVLETRIPPFGRQTRQPEAIEPDAKMANDLRDRMYEVYGMLQPSRKGEIRAVWDHSGRGLYLAH